MRRSLNEKLISFLGAATLICLAVLLQVSFPVLPSVFGARAFLIIPFVVCGAMYKGEFYGTAFGIFAGAVWDSVSPLPDGILALTLGVVGFTVALLSKKYMRRVLRTSALFTVLGSLAVVSLMVAYYAFGCGFESISPMLGSYYIPCVFYTLVVNVPVYYIYRFFFASRAKDGRILNS